jgi:proline iminopeptidase
MNPDSERAWRTGHTPDRYRMREGNVMSAGTHSRIDTLFRPFDTLLSDPSNLFRHTWRSHWLGAGLVVSLAVITGLIIAVLMPRGPVSAGEALTLMAVGTAIGLIAGFTMRSGWAMLLTPVALLIAFELGRVGTDGPLVDGIRLDGTWGIAALVLGRGFFVLIGISPMLVGASIGTSLARYLSGTSEQPATRFATIRYYARRTVLALTIAGLVILTLAIARPATTPAILGPDGEQVPGSIATLETVELGGAEQAIMLRGHSIDNPILLSLAGGPGGTDLAYTRVLLDEIEKDFVVVSWDQRGVAKSYGALDPVTTMTPEQAVSDTIELTNYLRQRFDEDKIYLMGESWGSILGIMTVQEQSDLFHAYIGTGQMVSPKETDQRLFQDMLDYATATGDSSLYETMVAFGEPPYEDIYAYAHVMGYYDALQPFTPLPEPAAKVEEAGVGMMGMMASEYSLMDKVNLFRGLIDTFNVMYPQLQEVDFRVDASQLEVPVYLIHGKYELDARGDLVPGYFEQLQAPRKLLVEFEHGSHSPAFDDPESFRTLLTETILPETYSAE